MKSFKKRIVCDGSVEYYTMHWGVINAIFKLDLTNAEISLLSHFMSHRTDEYIFDTTTRRQVMDKLDVSPSFISNYLKGLIEKGIVVESRNDRDVRQLKITPVFIPNKDVQEYLIRLESEGTN